MFSNFHPGEADKKVNIYVDMFGDHLNMAGWHQTKVEVELIRKNIILIYKCRVMVTNVVVTEESEACNYDLKYGPLFLM